MQLKYITNIDYMYMYQDLPYSKLKHVNMHVFFRKDTWFYCRRHIAFLHNGDDLRLC